MIKRFGSYISIALAMAAGMTACNDNSGSGYVTEDTGYTSETMYSSTAITSFNLKANSKVLADLDSIFFTIDLETGRIFNADSLPYGTDITKLIPNIGTSGSSKIEILIRNSSVMKDTTITYSSSMRDSIDFSAGGVIARVTSLNEQYTQQYSIRVNVHKVKSDSLVWDRIAWQQLPGNPEKQRTILHGEKVYTFLQSADGSCRIAVMDDPIEPMALTATATLPEGFNLRSIVSNDAAFFALDNDGKMYTSTDGTAWTATGETWSHIYGAYESQILGVKKTGDDYYYTTYPDNGTSVKVAADCPVSGTSDLLLMEGSKWADGPQAIFTGGRIANGNLTGATWSYDGSKWAKISETPIDRAKEGMSLFPYFTYRKANKSWRVTKLFTLFATGGRLGDGNVSNYVYVSRDMGITWERADRLMQFPSYIPAFYNADAIVWASELGSRSSVLGWNEMASPAIPAWLTPLTDGSRAVTPVTTWECPYIYLYGGDNASGSLNPQVWRGVINRLTFKPLI